VRRAVVRHRVDAPASGGRLEEARCGRPARIGEPDLSPSGRQARQQRDQRRDVALLVEHVGGEHQGPWRAERLGSAGPPEQPRRECNAVALGVARCHRDGFRRPVGRQHAAAGRRGGDRRQPETAAELDRAAPCEGSPGDHAGKRERARPQLGPVGHELVAFERLLSEQCLAVARREQQQLAIGECHHVFDQVVDGRFHFLKGVTRSQITC